MTAQEIRQQGIQKDVRWVDGFLVYTCLVTRWIAAELKWVNEVYTVSYIGTSSGIVEFLYRG